MADEVFGVVGADWSTPATRLIGKSCGRASVVGRRYTSGYYHFAGDGRRGYYHVDGTMRVATLKIGREVWMVDDPQHWIVIQEHARLFWNCRHVLVMGLGLGLIVEAIRAISDCQITIVERCNDVLGLHNVQKTAARGCWQVCGDAWAYLEQHGRKYDGVYCDLLVGDGRDLCYEAISQAINLGRHTKAGTVTRILGFGNLEQYVKAGRDVYAVEEMLCNSICDSPAQVKSRRPEPSAAARSMSTRRRKLAATNRRAGSA